jgi:hypothetical protein
MTYYLQMKQNDLDQKANSTMHNSVAVYQIRIEGELDQRWSTWFSGLKVSLDEGPEGFQTTLLTGELDQAALRGVLNKIWDLNLVLISLSQIDESEIN